MLRLLLATLFISSDDSCILCGLKINSFHLFDYSCYISKSYINFDSIKSYSISCWCIWKTYCSILLKKHENINFYDQNIIKFFIGDYVKQIFKII